MSGQLSYCRAKSGDAAPLIADLLLVHEPNLLANLLGVKRVALSWRKHPLPVCRAALMLHLMTFSGGDRVTVFALLTGCRYQAKDRVNVAGKGRKTPQ